MMIFDTHAHYNDEAYNEDLDQVINEMKPTVCGIINCATNYASYKKTLELCEKYEGFIYAAFGVHPSELESEYKEEVLLEFLNSKHCVAVGEIGLDYHYLDFDKESQKEWLINQIKLAKVVNKPVILHDRDSHADILEIIKEYRPNGVLHCFSGSVEMAREVLKCGLYIGIGGVVTFKNAKKTVEVVKELPLDRLLLETDAPYLSPEPFRGKRNTSSNIAYVAEKIAEIKGITPEEVLKANLENTKKLFGI